MCKPSVVKLKFPPMLTLVSELGTCDVSFFWKNFNSKKKGAREECIFKPVINVLMLRQITCGSYGC